MEATLLFSLIILLVVISGGMMFLFKRIMEKRISTASQHMDDINRDYIKKREEAENKLNEARNIYEESLKKAEQESLEIKRKAVEEANSEKERILQNTRRESEELIKKGEKTRQQLVVELEHRIERQAVKKGVELLAGTLPREVCLIMHKYLVDSLLESGFKNFSEIELSEDIGKAEAVTAFALDDKEQRSLVSVLKEAYKRDFSVNQRVDPKMLAGFKVQLGSLVIDGSLYFKIKEKAQQALRELE